MGATWNRFKRMLNREKEKTASAKTITGKPYRKIFDSWTEHSEHYKRMSENKEHEKWIVKNVKKDRRTQLDRKKIGIVDAEYERMQFDTKFKRKQLENALKEFGIEKKDGTLIIGAGYIGKFARAFKPLLPWKRGYKIAFTDLNPEYVNMAKKGRTITKGGRTGIARKINESFLLDLETPHINDTKASAIVSFEGVPFLSYSNSMRMKDPNSLANENRWAISKNLGAKNGIVIFKGKLQKDIGYPAEFGKTYGVKIKKIKVNKDMRAYQIKIDPKYKNIYLQDRKAHESIGTYSEIAEKLGISKRELMTRINRFSEAFKLI